MRSFVALLTVLGGALSLAAAFIILTRSMKARQHERQIAAMKVDHARKIKEHDRAYDAYEHEVLLYHVGTSETQPVAPFGGTDKNDHAEEVETWYRVRYEKLLGYEPGNPPVEPLTMGDAFLAELSIPAILAGIGVIISTGASVWSLYLP